MKQELSEIKERLSKTEDLFKKKQKVKYGIAVASCLTTSDMFPSEDEEDGRPENAKYTTDFDLLPNKHPKATK